MLQDPCEHSIESRLVTCGHVRHHRMRCLTYLPNHSFPATVFETFWPQREFKLSSCT